MEPTPESTPLNVQNTKAQKPKAPAPNLGEAKHVAAPALTREDLRDAVQSATRSPAELRAAEREAAQRKREAAARVVPLIPTEEGNVEDAYQTERALEEAARLEAEAKAATAQALEDTYQFFVKCRYPHGTDEKGRARPQHALYLKRNPGAGVVKANEWRATYKPTYDEPWLGEIVCQVCLRAFDAERVPDITVGKRGTFTVHDRWLWRHPKDLERLKAEGETRANDVQYASSNTGRAEASERAREAGLEVIA